MPMINGDSLSVCQSYRDQNGARPDMPGNSNFRGRRLEMDILDDWCSVESYEEFMQFMKNLPEVKPKNGKEIEPVIVMKSSYK